MSIQTQALEYIQSMGKRLDPDSIVEFIRDITKSYNSALVQISGLRQVLKTISNQPSPDIKGYAHYSQLADDLLYSPVYRELLTHARKEAEQALEEGVEEKDSVDQAVINRLGDYNTIYKELIQIVDDLEEGKREVNIRDLIYAIINFSARPIDILQMKFQGDKLTNWGKQRDSKTNTKDTASNQTKSDYLGFLPVEDAKYLLHRVQMKYSKVHRETLMRDLRQSTNSLLGCNPRDLRRISSIILSSTEPNRIKRIKKQQAILRHKSPLTSVLYYT